MHLKKFRYLKTSKYIFKKFVHLKHLTVKWARTSIGKVFIYNYHYLLFLFATFY